jgi:hypothetical protein
MPRIDLSAREPGDENNQPSALQFKITVTQKATWNDSFFDL